MWKVAALTKGLEDEQRAVDEALSNSGQAKPAVTAAVAPNAAEIERQRKLADAAAKEKQRLKVEAEKRQKELALRQVEADRKAAAERERREKMERERRAALAAAQKAEQEAAEAARAAAKPVKRASPLMSSPVDLDDIALDDIIPPVAKPRAVKRPTPKPVVRTPKPSAKTLKTPVAQSTRLWAGASVNTEAIKTYEVPADSLANRDRKVADKMGDICQVMVEIGRASCRERV